MEIFGYLMALCVLCGLRARIFRHCLLIYSLRVWPTKRNFFTIKYGRLLPPVPPPRQKEVDFKAKSNCSMALN